MRQRWKRLGSRFSVALRYLPAVAALVVGSVGGNHVADTMSADARDLAERRFDEAVENVAFVLAQDLEDYLTDLNDIAAFTGTHDPPSAEDFDWFIEQSRYMAPGARQLLIYVELVEPEELLAFIEQERALGDPGLVPLSMHYGADGPMMFITRSASQESTDPPIPIIDVSSLPRAAQAFTEAARLRGPVPIDLDLAMADIRDPDGPIADSGIDIDAVMNPILDYVSGGEGLPDSFGYGLVMPVYSGPASTSLAGWIVGGLDPPNLLSGFERELAIMVRLGADGPLVATGSPLTGMLGHETTRSFTSGGLDWWIEVEAGADFGLPAGALSSARVARIAAYGMSGLLALLLAVRTLLRHRNREMQGQLEHTSHRARHDPLTGLMNRSAMRDELERLCETNTTGSIGVLFIDLDRLKLVNDSLGHSVGDLMLRAAADRLNEAVGSAGVLSRFGGDEFVVVMDQLDSVDEAVVLARKLIVALNPPLSTAQLELSLTASIGISLAPAGLADSETLISDADAAMYAAKGAGGNGYAVFDERLRERVTGRLELEHALRFAISAGELSVFFQPIVDVERDRIVSAEALVRWNRGELGMVGPIKFLPVANETGMIVQIGELVIEQTCELIARLRSFDPEHPVGVAINLSERELLAPRLVERLSAALSRHGVPPELMTVEINEDVVVDGHSRAIDVLRMIDHLGVRLAIDDFGTGLSSLGHVKRLDMLSAIKIDKTFIEDIDTDDADQAIVSAVVAMSGTLHHQVIAEGVERVEQEEVLRRLGVHLMQGHRWSQAVPADELIELVRASALDVERARL